MQWGIVFLLQMQLGLFEPVVPTTSFLTKFAPFILPIGHKIFSAFQDFVDSQGRRVLDDLQPLLRCCSCIPVSSAECERVFSQMNLVCTSVRNRLLIERISNLMFVKLHGPPMDAWNPDKYGKSCYERIIQLMIKGWENERLTKLPKVRKSRQQRSKQSGEYFRHFWLFILILLLLQIHLQFSLLTLFTIHITQCNIKFCFFNTNKN